MACKQLSPSRKRSGAEECLTLYLRDGMVVQLLRWVSCEILSCGPADSGGETKVAGAEGKNAYKIWTISDVVVVGREEEPIMIIFRHLC